MVVMTSIKSCLKVDYKTKIHNLHSWILLFVIKLTCKDAFISRGLLKRTNLAYSLNFFWVASISLTQVQFRVVCVTSPRSLMKPRCPHPRCLLPLCL